MIIPRYLDGKNLGRYRLYPLNPNGGMGTNPRKTKSAKEPDLIKSHKKQINVGR